VKIDWSLRRASDLPCCIEICLNNLDWLDARRILPPRYQGYPWWQKNAGYLLCSHWCFFRTGISNSVHELTILWILFDRVSSRLSKNRCRSYNEGKMHLWTTSGTIGSLDFGWTRLKAHYAALNMKCMHQIIRGHTEHRNSFLEGNTENCYNDMKPQRQLDGKRPSDLAIVWLLSNTSVLNNSLHRLKWLENSQQ
jgi:hypothetical protein